MKTLIALMLGAGSALSIASAQISLPGASDIEGAQSVANAKSGIIAYFPMDGSVVEQVSGKSALNSRGNATPVPGVIGQAMRFNGDSVHEFEIDLNPDKYGDLTVTAYVRLDALPQDVTGLATEGVVMDGGSLGLSVKNHKKDQGIASGDGNWDGAHVLPREQWNFMAMTITSEVRDTANGPKRFRVKKLYSRDAVTEFASEGDIPGGSRTLFIGNLGLNANYALTGAIDEMRIFNRALSEDEIRTMINQGPTAPVRDIMTDGNIPANRTENNETPAEEGDDPRQAATPATGEIQSTNTIGDDIVLDQRGIDATPPPVIADGRQAAEPVAGQSADGANTPVFEAPNEQAKEFEERVDDPEFQDGLNTFDWRIVGPTPETTRLTLVPGAEVELSIRVKKHDPANKMPDVTLQAQPKLAAPMVSAPIRIVTSTQLPEGTRDIPIVVKVPSDLEFADGSTTALWKPKVTLWDKNGAPFSDADNENHTRQLSLVVNHPRAEECAETVENEDGTRTVGECLNGTLSVIGSEAPQGSAEFPLPRVDVSSSSDTDFSGSDDPVDTEQRITLNKHQSVIGHIKIAEKADVPCRIAIDDAVPDNHEPGAFINQCKKNNFGEQLELGVVPGWGITGLETCLNRPDFAINHKNLDTRVKGVRVSARPILANGDLGNDQRTSDFRQTNCGDYKKKVSCPEGTVAYGLRIASVGRGEKAPVFNFWQDNASTPISKIGLVCAKPLPWKGL